jgi:hypothetical protein
LRPPLLGQGATDILQDVWDAIVPFQHETNGLSGAVKEVRSHQLLNSLQLLNCGLLPLTFLPPLHLPSCLSSFIHSFLRCS